MEKMLNKLRSLAQTTPIINAALDPFRRLRRGFNAVRFDPTKNFFDNMASAMACHPKIKVPEFNGIFTLSAKSDLFRRVIRDGVYEPKLVARCRNLVDKNKDVIDVGANVGFYTIFFAKLISNSHRVFAVEPTPNALKCLRINLLENDVIDRVVVFDGVAMDINGEIELRYIEDREEYSSVGLLAHPSIVGEICKTISVPAKTIDSMVDEYSLVPGFVKIDVEGMEHRVINGMKKVMKNFRPVILAELSNPLLLKNGSNSAEVISTIEKFDYTVIDPLNENIGAGKRTYGDIICIPNEEYSRVM